MRTFLLLIRQGDETVAGLRAPWCEVERKIFRNLTQEAINDYKNEDKPIIFHETTDDYWEEIHGDYYLWHEFHFRVDEKWDYEETMETLRKTLIEHELL